MSPAAGHAAPSVQRHARHRLLNRQYLHWVLLAPFGFPRAGLQQAPPQPATPHPPLNAVVGYCWFMISISLSPWHLAFESQPLNQRRTIRSNFHAARRYSDQTRGELQQRTASRACYNDDCFSTETSLFD